MVFVSRLENCWHNPDIQLGELRAASPPARRIGTPHCRETAVCATRERIAAPWGSGGRTQWLWMSTSKGGLIYAQCPGTSLSARLLTPLSDCRDDPLNRSAAAYLCSLPAPPAPAKRNSDPSEQRPPQYRRRLWHHHTSVGQRVAVPELGQCPSSMLDLLILHSLSSR